MWLVVYIAPNKQEAERIQKTLSAEGMLVRLRCPGVRREKTNRFVEVLVPESEADEALEIINEIK